MIPDGDHIKEIHEETGGVALHVLDLVCQLAFEFGAHEGDGDVGVVGEQVGAVVGVFEELDKLLVTDLS